MRLERAEQENRELHAEQARLIGAIQERDAALAALQDQLAAGGEEAKNPQTARTM
jgi:hypothetical protein